MATKHAERELLKSAYKGEKWAQKVDKMSDKQIIAVLMRLKAQGVIK